jgi:hypothetical protein
MLVPLGFPFTVLDLVTRELSEFVGVLNFSQLSVFGVLRLTLVLILLDHEERDGGLGGSILIDRAQDVAGTREVKLEDLLRSQCTNILKMETVNRVRLDLEDINETLGGLIRVVSLTSFENTLAVGVDTKLGLVRLEDNAVEINDVTVERDLLMRDHVSLHFLRLKELDSVLRLLLDRVLAHNSEVVTLRMPVDAHLVRVLQRVHVEVLTGRHRLDGDTGQGVLTRRETRVNDSVLVRSPAEVFKALDVDRGTIALVILDELAVLKRIDGDIGTHLGLLFRLLLFLLVSDGFLGDLSNVVTVITPLESRAIFSSLLLEVTLHDLLREIPDLVRSVIHGRVDHDKALARREGNGVNLGLGDTEDGLHGLATEEFNSIGLDQDEVGSARTPLEGLVRDKVVKVGLSLGRVKVVKDLGLAIETLNDDVLLDLEGILVLLSFENLSVKLEVVSLLGVLLGDIVEFLAELLVVRESTSRDGMLLVKLVAIEVEGTNLGISLVLEGHERLTSGLDILLVPAHLDLALVDRELELAEDLDDKRGQLDDLHLVTLGQTVHNDVLGEVSVELGA